MLTRTVLRGALLTLVLFAPLFALASDSIAAPSDPRDDPRLSPELVDPGEEDGAQQLWLSNADSPAFLARDACPDTFVLYGGAGSLEGKFQTEYFAPDMQGWTGLDLTDESNAWRVSTFNAENLGGHGSGNHAMWVGYSDAERPSWATPPGYGNNWDMSLEWSSGPLVNPAAGQTVVLDFLFNLDVEPGYDFVRVDYESQGTWKNVLEMDGTTRALSGQFLAPGEAYRAQSPLPIVYAGGDYSGAGSNEIRLRIRFESDGAWSDEDGLWDTDGAIQVDDISISWTDGGVAQQVVEDFEGTSFAWTGSEVPFAGDFARVFPRFTDIDPCRDNDSPVIGFIDDGTPPANDPAGRSTGGSLSPTWDYGIPGGWVVNYTGGLSLGFTSLNNAVVSPPIAWDVPGSCDDEGDVVRLYFEADLFLHTPGSVLPTGMWRTSSDGGANWSGWTPRGLWPLGSGSWVRFITAPFPLEMSPPPTHVQVAFVARDLSEFWALPQDASAAPVFDNVRVLKLRVHGPLLTGFNWMQDAFAYSGAWDVSTPAARDAMDIRCVAWRDDPADGIDPLLADLSATLPGLSIQEVTRVWTLEKNPLFEDALRQVPARTVDVNVDTSDPRQWYGEVQGVLVEGDAVEGSWDTSLPDLDFMYPGDVLRHYFRVIDSQGRVFTAPLDISGFVDGTDYPKYYVRRGLPSYRTANGETPRVLIVQRAGNAATTRLALSQLGLRPGVDYDLWDQLQPGIVNHIDYGLGAAGRGGATFDQLRGYDTIVFLTGDRGGTWPLLGDGINGSDEIGLLTAWLELPGPRNLALFGSDLARALSLTPLMSTFLQESMGTSYIDYNVRDEIGDQLVSAIMPDSPWFTVDFSVASGCGWGIGPDSVTPFGAAERGHVFLDATGQPTDAAASVLTNRTVDGDTKKTAFFPFDVNATSVRFARAPGTSTTAAKIFEELFNWAAVPTGGANVTAVIANPRGISEIVASPNPFNPRLAITFVNGRKAHTRVEVFNVRGERVAVLVDAEIEAGPQRFVWDGTDDDGSPVASGVYLLRAASGDVQVMKKVALIR